MNKLLPCPFCNGKAELIIVPGYFKSGLSSSGWLVKCLNGCCNQTPYTSDHDAVEAWNRREQVIKQTKTLYDFDSEFEELMGQAVNDLSPKQFAKFLDDISMMLADYEDGQEGE